MTVNGVHFAVLALILVVLLLFDHWKQTRRRAERKRHLAFVGRVGRRAGRRIA